MPISARCPSPAHERGARQTGDMVIVGGTFEVEPSQREQFIAGRLDMIRTSRGEDGCLEYTYAADPIEPGRVILFERWSDQEALDAHIAALRAGPRSSTPAVATISSSIVIYDVAAERPFV
jgi:quinol monooxygenase YgiN